MAVNKNISLNHTLPKQVGWNGYFESREEIATSPQARCVCVRLVLPVPDFLWKLCIGDQETGDVVGVEKADESVDFGVHDWLTHQGECTVFDRQALLVSLWLHSGDTWSERGSGVSSTF